MEDVIRANLAAAKSDAAVGRSVNIGTGQAVAIRELAEMIVDIADSDSNIIHTDSRAGDIGRIKADIKRARSVLGFDAAVPIESGLKDVLDSYRARNR